MPKLTIFASSESLDSSYFQTVNIDLDRLSKVAIAELIDAGFFEKAKIDKLTIEIRVVDSQKNDSSYEQSESKLKVLKKIPLEFLEKFDHKVAMHHIKNAASRILEEIAETYQIEKRSFEIRTSYTHMDLLKAIKSGQLVNIHHDDILPKIDPPALLSIDPDDHHAKFVGKMNDGRQFFLTQLFEPAIGKSDGCEYLALFIFDDKGKLIESKIENFGPRHSMSHSALKEVHKQYMEYLGDVSYERINVETFSISREGTDFGLILNYSDANWYVELHPGNFMSFSEPWDSGIYDT